jgi:hypothetical protein
VNDLDPAVINGHRVTVKRYRYECVNCGARLLSAFQFTSRECPNGPPPLPVAEEPQRFPWEDPTPADHPPCCVACDGQGATMSGPCFDCRGTGHAHA